MNPQNYPYYDTLPMQNFDDSPDPLGFPLPIEAPLNEQAMRNIALREVQQQMKSKEVPTGAVNNLLSSLGITFPISSPITATELKQKIENYYNPPLSAE